MFSKILIASDGSEYALEAARVAASLTEKFGSSLTVLHVYAPPMPPLSLAGVPGIDLSPDAWQEAADAECEEVRRCNAEALDITGVPYTFRSEVGYPAEAILRIAAAERFDLVVLGNRGRSGVTAFLLGSVSERVAHHVHCAVLIVKHPKLD